MTNEDFNLVTTRSFDKRINLDATPNGQNFIKYFSMDAAEKEVFLGGTCNNSTWRDEFVKHLTLPYFNPVVENWNAKAKKAEEDAKLRCGIHLYVITPKMTGTFAIAEAVKSAVVNPKGTVFVICIKDGDDKFNGAQVSSLESVGNIVMEFGGRVHMVSDINSFKRVAEELSKIKRGFASTMVTQLQSHPIKFGGVHGIQVYDLITLSRSIIQFFNDKFGCEFNIRTIKYLKDAKTVQEDRTRDRKNRKVEGYDKD